MCTKITLNEITNRVVEVVSDSLGSKLDRVILYGSYARGDFDGESDIDILVLANIPKEDADKLDMQLTRFTSRLGLENDIVVSLFVKDSETFYKFLPADPFYQNVIKDGVLLNA